MAATSRKRSKSPDFSSTGKLARTELNISSKDFSSINDADEEYKRLVCALYTFKFSTSDEVLDFVITKNRNFQFDIKMEVTFQEKKKRSYFFLIKQKLGDDFNFDKILDTSENGQDHIYIVYTNDKQFPVTLPEETNLEYQNLLLNVKEDVESIQCRVKNSKLYFFYDQKTIKTLGQDLREMLQNLLQCDIYNSFIDFMVEKRSLTKHDFITKLTELALSPYIIPISNKQCNPRTKLLEEAIMQFEMTIVEKCDESIWTCGDNFDIQDSIQRWYLGYSPLIIKIDDLNKTTVASVLKLLKTDLQNKKIMIIGDVKSEFSNWDIFGNLSHLHHRNEKLYEEILASFQVPLQGEKSIPLEELVKIDQNIINEIGVKQLREMALIAPKQEDIPDFYIPRKLSPILVDLEDIVNHQIFKENCLIVIYCDKVFEEKLRSKNQNFGELSQYLTDSNGEKFETMILLSTEDSCPSVQFKHLCKKSRSYIYVFRMIDEETCILLYRNENEPSLDAIVKQQKFVEEETIFDYFSNTLNVIFGIVGSGKTSFLQALSTKHCPKDCWAIYIDLKKYDSFLQKFPKTEEIFTQFLDGDRFPKTKSILLEKKKICFFFDDLHEIEISSFNVLVEFIKYISSEGFTVWVSSEHSLKRQVLEKFNTMGIEFEELTTDEQRRYMHEKLSTKYSSEETESIIQAVLKSEDFINSQHLIGAPIQLYILTEVFLKNKYTYKNFVITKMLNLFYEDHLETYELQALKTCLTDKDFKKLNLDVERDANFNYQIFPEFLASLWFEKHPEKIKCLEPEWFTDQYQNLRLIFDILMAENQPLFLGVIYQNVTLIEEHIGPFGIDKGGRNVLHLAFSHATKYPTYSEYPIYETLNRESQTYVKMIDFLTHQSDVFADDALFGLNCLDYAIKSQCLYPIEKMLEAGRTCFGDFEKTLCEIFEDEILAYYSARMGYPKLLSSVLEREPDLSCYSYGDYTLLDIAVLGTENDGSVPPRQGNIDVVALLFSHDSHILDYNGGILQMACKEGRFDMIKILTENDCTCHDDGTILHAIAADNWLNEEIFDFNFDVNSQNYNGATALHLASVEGRFDNIKQLLEHGARIDMVDNEERTALHYAARKNNSEVIKLLLQNGLDVNVQDRDGRTPLAISCTERQVKNVETFLTQGSSVDIVDNKSDSPLHYATQTRKNNSEVILLLLNYGIDVNVKNKTETTPLQIACKEGQETNVKTLLEANANLNCTDKSGNKCLHYAAQSDHDTSEVIDLLITYGVDVNYQNKDGSTPLHLACLTCEDLNVKKLLQIGANFNIVDKNNSNALHYVAKTKREHNKIIDMIVTTGLSVNSQNAQNETPLHLAFKNQNIGFARILQEKGADINLLTSKGRNMLHYAVSSGSCEVTKEVLHLGFDVNSCDLEKVSVLHLACKYGDYSSVQTLIEANVDLLVVDNQKRTALHYAVECESLDERKFKSLLNSDIDQNAVDLNGKTALDCAIEDEQFVSLKILIEIEAFPDILTPNNEKFLYWSVYTGCSYGVNLFLKNRRADLDNIDYNYKDFPLYFATIDGKLNFDLLIKLTRLIGNFIIYSIKHSHLGMVAYLKHFFSQDEEISVIYKKTEKFTYMCQDFKKYIEENNFNRVKKKQWI